MNRQLKEKFHIEKDLDAVFIDSWAKQDWNLDDFIQQEAFTRETTKLWNSFSSYSTFEFKTIQGNINLFCFYCLNALKTFVPCYKFWYQIETFLDVIEELTECKKENACLNGEIQDQLSQLEVRVEAGEVMDQEQNTGIPPEYTKSTLKVVYLRSTVNVSCSNEVFEGVLKLKCKLKFFGGST